MRLFIAIPLSPAVKAKLCKLYEPLENIRWQPAQQLHLTLRFIGEAQEQERKIIQEKLEGVHQASFEWVMQGVRSFPEKGSPKIIWVGIQKNESLLHLYKAIKQCCAGRGYETSKRRFQPHITIGRVKGTPLKKVRTFLNRHKNWGPETMQVQAFGLFASRLNPEGAVHETLKRYLLKKNKP